MQETGYVYEEHTADIIIIAWGPTLEKAFEKAGEAITAIMTDPSKIEEKTTVKVKVEGFDLENLLLRWIEEILFYFDSEGLLFKTYKVTEIKKEDDTYILEAELKGEKFDPAKHESWTHVKAATYAQMSIRKEDGVWKLKFVVDI